MFSVPRTLEEIENKDCIKTWESLYRDVLCYLLESIPSIQFPFLSDDFILSLAGMEEHKYYQTLTMLRRPSEFVPPNTDVIATDKKLSKKIAEDIFKNVIAKELISKVLRKLHQIQRSYSAINVISREEFFGKDSIFWLDYSSDFPFIGKESQFLRENCKPTCQQIINFLKEKEFKYTLHKLVFNEANNQESLGTSYAQLLDIASESAFVSILVGSPENGGEIPNTIRFDFADKLRLGASPKWTHTFIASQKVEQ